MTNEDFKDIAPYGEADFQSNLKELVKEPGFEHAIRYIMPGVDYDAFVAQLLMLKNTDEFQIKVMMPFLEMLAKNTTDGITSDGFDEIKKGDVYTFISNHRDIVLDASFLNVCLLRYGLPTSEIALGDNLLIFEWIEKLVKINKGFIVKRNLRLLEAFKAAKQLSSYIRYCLVDKHESVWIAQREGRAKDSNDVTQESVIKMLALSAGDNVVDGLIQLNICPTTISYEYDPNDYLKAAEFLQRHRNPEHKKSQHDDLHAMEIGLTGRKGKVHFHLNPCINPELEKLREVTDKNELFPAICAIIDKEIHSGYKIFPINYISYDRVTGEDRFADRYTQADIDAFNAYFEQQLAKVNLPDLTAEDYEFMRTRMMEMYANPLRNLLQAKGE
ncbi:MAG: acyltransferase [Muribaculaceae bacterium]|nr:acyltransferase [Muribaculaceae bacterium]